MDKSDGSLLLVIDKNIRYIFGDINARIIHDYLGKKRCAFQKTPARPNTFSTALRSMLGSKHALMTMHSCILLGAR